MQAVVEIPTTQCLYAALLWLEPVVLAALLQSGDRMSKSEIYRKHAQDCLKLADKFTLEHFRVLRNREGIPKQGDL